MGRAGRDRARSSLLVGRLWQLQVMRGESYYERTVSNVVKERYLPSVRGKILDRKGVAARRQPARVQHLRDAEAARRRETKAELARLLGLSDDEIAKIDERLALGKQARSAARRSWSSRIRAAIAPRSSSRRASRLPGVEVHHEPYRYYPQGDLAAHLIGYMTQMTAEEADRLTQPGLRHERARRPLRPRGRVGELPARQEGHRALRGRRARPAPRRARRPRR